MRWPSAAWRTCPGSNGSIMPCSVAMRRIHLSLLMLIERSLNGSAILFGCPLAIRGTVVFCRSRRRPPAR
jgi:hypothetical protein